MSKTPPPALTAEQRVAAALNEQGFLFSQAIRDKVKFDRPGNGLPQKAWKYVTQEYAVTAADGSQTRIDLVLQHARSQGHFLCVECKRANPHFKQWVFFDQEFGPGGTAHADAYFEEFHVTQRPITKTSSAHHAMVRHMVDSCAVFNMYLEVAVDRNKKWGHTETIEDAFLQVTQGQTGFMAKQLTFEGPFDVKAIPVVVTTAKLFNADFDTGCVSLEHGMINPSDLKLNPIEFCAVNYHANDSLAVRSKYSVGIVAMEHDVVFQVRTVFVVQAEAVISFLNWVSSTIVRK